MVKEVALHEQTKEGYMKSDVFHNIPPERMPFMLDSVPAVQNVKRMKSADCDNVELSNHIPHIVQEPRISVS